MQESIQAALSVVRNRSSKLGVAEDFYQKNDIHVHLPEGATPKGRPERRNRHLHGDGVGADGNSGPADLAMTGEITLRGEVLVIGGLKEKLLAAHRAASRPFSSRRRTLKDLAEIPDNIKNRLEILPVKWMDQVLELALEHLPEPRKPRRTRHRFRGRRRQDFPHGGHSLDWCSAEQVSLHARPPKFRHSASASA